jgi:hypothetical protein
VSTLHERLLAALADDRFDSPTEVRLARAHRAVVELHAPAPGWTPPFCTGCTEEHDMGRGADWPCSTIQAIARELRVHEGGDRG